MLKIVPVLVNNRHATYGFIDCGAAPTLVTRSLVDKLGLRGKPCNQTMITEAGTFVCKEVLPLDLGNIDGSEGEHVQEAFVTDKINVSTDSLMPGEWLKKWPHLKGIELHTLPGEDPQVELIIGLNTTLNRIILDQRHGDIREPSAHLTKLGWVVFGPTGQDGKQAPKPIYHVHVQEDTTELLQANFNRDFWEKDALSVVEDSVEDKRFLAKMSETVYRENGKYVASLPLREDSPLPDNYEMALRRAQTLRRKLERDEPYRDSYVAQMEKYIHKDYAE